MSGLRLAVQSEGKKESFCAGPSLLPLFSKGNRLLVLVVWHPAEEVCVGHALRAPTGSNPGGAAGESLFLALLSAE